MKTETKADLVIETVEIAPKIEPKAIKKEAQILEPKVDIQACDEPSGSIDAGQVLAVVALVSIGYYVYRRRVRARMEAEARQ